jgi:hypothetical protein
MDLDHQANRAIVIRYYLDIKKTSDYLYDSAKLSERRENRRLRSFNALYQYYRLNVNTSKRRVHDVVDFFR